MDAGSNDDIFDLAGNPLSAGVHYRTSFDCDGWFFENNGRIIPFSNRLNLFN